MERKSWFEMKSSDKSIIPFNPVHQSDETLQAFISGLAGLTQLQGDGPFSRKCEGLLSNIFEKQVVLLDSCTSALELGTKLMNFEAGSEVIMPSFNFTSSANACIINDLVPVFSEIELDSLNLDPEKILERITPKTRAIMVIHYAGISADLTSIQNICDENDLILLEDNAHGLSGSYKNQMLGTFGAYSAMSFHATKNYSSGEGGALLLQDPEKVKSAEIYREKGTNRAQFFRGEVDKYSWQGSGSSMVMSELSALYLYPQLCNFSEIHERRLGIWLRYHSALISWAEKNGVSIARHGDHIQPAGHIFWVLFSEEQQAIKFRKHLLDNGISSTGHYQALDSSKFALTQGYSQAMLEISQRVSNGIVRLPIYFSLTDLQVDRIIEVTISFKN